MSTIAKNLSAFALILGSITLKPVMSEVIVDISDKLIFTMQDPFTNETIPVYESDELYSFPWNTNYTKNTSVSGYFCSARNYDVFNETCYSVKNLTNTTYEWIVMIPFGGKNAQKLLDQIENGTVVNTNALIMVANDMVVSENLLEKPLIITQVDMEDNLTFYKYGWNMNNSLMASVHHTFVERCYLLNPVWPTHLALAGAWLLVAFSWWLLTYKINKAHTLYMQRILFLVPCSKFLECLINGLFYNACPWLGAQDPGEKYLEMARISIITVVYTMMLALFYVISRGWQTLIFQMTRDQATSLTMIMGGVYLCYSAYFLSSDFSGISNFMRVMMSLLFLGLAYTGLSSLRKCILILKAHGDQAQRDDPNLNIMEAQLKLKEKQLIVFGILSTLFYLGKVVNYGVISFMHSASLSVYYGTGLQCFEFLFLCGILFTFRSRPFPPFYSIGLNEMMNPFGGDNQEPGNGARRIMAPLLETLISPELFTCSPATGAGREEVNEADIGARENIIVLNPNKYTIQEEEDEDEEMRQEQVSLNDSFEDDEKELKGKKKDDKKKKKKGDKEPKKQSPTPQSEKLVLDPVELMPNIKIGQKERRQVRRIRNNNQESNSSGGEEGNGSVAGRGMNVQNQLF